MEREDTATPHFLQKQASPVQGTGSCDSALSCTTTALLSVFFTFTVFSGFGFAGSGAGSGSKSGAAAAAALVLEEDLLKKLRMKLLRLDFSITSKVRGFHKQTTIDSKYTAIKNEEIVQL